MIGEVTPWVRSAPQVRVGEELVTGTMMWGRRQWRGRQARLLSAAALLVTTLAACSGGGGGNVVNWYVFKEPGGAYDQAAATCSQQSGGRYQIKIQPLPTNADAIISYDWLADTSESALTQKMPRYVSRDCRQYSNAI